MSMMRISCNYKQKTLPRVLSGVMMLQLWTVTVLRCVRHTNALVAVANTLKAVVILAHLSSIYLLLYCAVV